MSTVSGAAGLTLTCARCVERGVGMGGVVAKGHVLLLRMSTASGVAGLTLTCSRCGGVEVWIRTGWGAKGWVVPAAGSDMCVRALELMRAAAWAGKAGQEAHGLPRAAEGPRAALNS
eukprot:5630-Chlamydomonas_euryale.AAC.2